MHTIPNGWKKGESVEVKKVICKGIPSLQVSRSLPLSYDSAQKDLANQIHCLTFNYYAEFVDWLKWWIN